MKQFSLSQDLSNLTRIPPSLMEKLIQDCIYILSYDVAEMLKENEDTGVVDIGFGTITFLIEEDTLKYKFIPSPRLEKSILQTLDEGISLLDKKVESKLSRKILAAYKDLI